MSNAAVLIGPIIVALLAAAAIVGLAAWVGLSALRALSLREEAARWSVSWQKVGRQVLRKQEDAIAAVIGELEARPATYETFPSDIRDALYSAHTMAREAERELTK